MPLTIMPPFREPYFRYVQSLNPLLYWRLGESSGITAVDSSGNGYNGTYQNAPTLGVTGLLANDSDTAVRLNGSTQYVTASHSATQITGDLSLSCLLNIDVIQTNRFFDQGAVSESLATNHLYIVKLVDAGASMWVQYIHERADSGNVVVNFDTTTQLFAGTTYHVDLIRDATAKTISVYINGVLAETKGYSDNAAGGTATSFYVGTAPEDLQYVDGIMDEVKIFDKKLTPAEIARMHKLSGI